MEVHHHSHTAADPDPSTSSGHRGRKKWTHYFWEFLMLFLAVFCGFLAEYQLEHKIEKDREKQFIKSLFSDLKDDTKNLDHWIENEEKGIAMLDTLFFLLDSPQLAKKNGDQLYYVARMGPRYLPFVNNSRTYDQLMNSGGFRLISNSKTSSKIMSYYTHFPWLRGMEENFNREFDDFKRIASKIFDPAVFRKQEGENATILRSDYNPALRSYDPELMKELAFYTIYLNGTRKTKLRLFGVMKKSVNELIQYLQEKYRLK